MTITRYPRNEKEFKEIVDQEKFAGTVFYFKCCNCCMPFSDECNREPIEWIKATATGMCGKCMGELVDHLSGDTSV